MRRAACILLLALAAPAGAQYPGHLESNKKAAPTVRAVAVLEWTGEMGKPSASRIIPISVFDGEQYQPGGLYLAKPQPLALEPGTEYVLEDAGVARGLFDINTRTGRGRLLVWLWCVEADGSLRPRRRSRSKARTCPRW